MNVEKWKLRLIVSDAFAREHGYRNLVNCSMVDTANELDTPYYGSFISYQKEKYLMKVDAVYLETHNSLVDCSCTSLLLVC